MFSSDASDHTSSPGAEILRYVRAIKRRSELILLPVVIVPCAALIGLSFIPSKYESSSVVRYAEKVPFGGDMERMLVEKPDYRVRDRERFTQMETRLKGRLFLGEAAQKLGITLSEQALRSLERVRLEGVSAEERKARAVIEALRKSIRIEEIGPDLFKITFSHMDGGAAYSLADGVTRAFVDYMAKGHVADIRAAGSFSEDQLPVYEQKLRRSEDALKRLRARMATQDGGGDAGSLERARSLLREADREISDLESRARAARERLRADYQNELDPTTLIRGSAIRSAYEQVVSAEEEGVSGLVGESTRASVAERVGQARERLLGRVEQVVRSMLSGSPVALQSLVTEIVYDEHVVNSIRARKRVLSDLIETYSRSLGRRPQDEVELRRLEQEVESNRTVLQSLRSQVTSARMSEAAQATSLGVRIEIVEPPAKPLRPAGPRKQRVMVLALILGPFLGLSLAVLSEYMDDTVRSIADVKRGVGLEVLGTIPRMPGDDFWHPARKRRWPVVVMIAGVCLALAFFVARGPVMGLLGKSGEVVEVPARVENEAE